MSRRHTETERLKVGNMKAVFFHREYDHPGGTVVSAWVSCGNKYAETDMGELLHQISERYHGIIAATVTRGGAG